MKFLHIADLHLGYKQYKSQERYDDFSAAFKWLMAYATEENVDAIVIAGDLFHKRTADPYVMRIAVEEITNASCTTILIEGNHEKSYFSEQESWIDYLGSSGFVYMLDKDSVTVGNTCFRGIKYAGAHTDEVVSEYVNTLEKSGLFTVLILHAGLEGQVSHVGKLSDTTIEAIKDKIDYVALGHIHKPYVVDNFVFNPGSAENVSAEEMLYPLRGAILVNVQDDKSFTHEFVVPPRREFHRMNIDVDGFTSPELIYEAVGIAIEADIGENTVIDFVISGEITFSRSDINTKVIRDMITTKLNPLVVHVKNDATPVGFGIAVDEARSEDVEKAVMLQVIKRDARYRGKAQFWTDAALTVKDLAIAGDSDGVITYLGGVV